MIKDIEFDFHSHSKVFDLLNIESKINYLKTFFKDEMRENEGALLNVVIAVPYFDSEMRVIQDVDDGWVYLDHLKSANKVKVSLKDDEKINVIDIVSDPRQSKAMEKMEMNIDYVVFLYPFTPLELNYIGAELASKTQYGRVNNRLHAVELL